MSDYNPTEEVFHRFDTKHKFADDRMVYNFSPGPCILPKAVLDVCNQEMYNFRGSGQSVMELTHRQDEFRYISIMTKREVRKFLRVPDHFRILINQGGATNQYTAVTKNLMNLKPHKKAMIINSGLWTS